MKSSLRSDEIQGCPWMKSNPIPCGAGFHHESDFTHASGFNPSRTDLIMQATACIIRPICIRNCSLRQVSANISSACPPSSRVSPICHSAKPYGQGNTRRAHVSRRRLIMPLVALVQKKSERTRNFVLSSGAWHSLRSSPLLLQFRLRKSECLLMQKAVFFCKTRLFHRFHP